MRATIRALLGAAGLAAALNVHAQGIPTMDASTIMQLAQQYQVLQDQFNRLGEMKNMAVGARGMGNIFNDPSIKSALPRDWQAVLGMVKGTPGYATARAKYPTSANPKANEYYDNLAAQDATTAQYFTQANDRLTQVQNLMNQIDLASDPAAKADLQARLISEQNAIQGTSQVLGLVQRRQQQELNAAGWAAQQEILCKEFKRPGC